MRCTGLVLLASLIACSPKPHAVEARGEAPARDAGPSEAPLEIGDAGVPPLRVPLVDGELHGAEGITWRSEAGVTTHRLSDRATTHATLARGKVSIVWQPNATTQDVFEFRGGAGAHDCRMLVVASDAQGSVRWESTPPGTCMVTVTNTEPLEGTFEATLVGGDGSTGVTVWNGVFRVRP